MGLNSRGGNMMKRAVAVTGLVGLAAGHALGQSGVAGKGKLQRISNGIEVQPLLWATGEDRGDPSAPGTQGPLQFDDDDPSDGVHGSGECYDHSIDECPFELGMMVGFWQRQCDDPCAYAHYNGDSTVNTQDVLAFLNSWNAEEAEANCNGDSTVNTQDFLCFLNIWNACR